MSDKAPALVILAAGLGTRFGGDKQTVPLGPGGATLMEYTIHDALAAGTERHSLLVPAEPRAKARGEDDERRRLLAHEDASPAPCGQSLGTRRSNPPAAIRKQASQNTPCAVRP